ncbi:hypothetical protein H4R33_006949 [Dimargaris cristalligena]|uniref:Uncharacterized protein n=1 Tax=Dimargaris cristalligena TaxID=215637 RepID=A0A4P9ZNL5_9FUNG|nr:hypothetical protein H4R33_006949 [Dimargaris cristalligena]RKP33900.1 hypothetical protein BJ085DRAFT_41629 [Dimargaris cristalligena]|eukprot:RKP33900.1 hypothetical protein BJ085DRAFT_41629 [Dimargaris cristalligena]
MLSTKGFKKLLTKVNPVRALKKLGNKLRHSTKTRPASSHSTTSTATACSSTPFTIIGPIHAANITCIAPEDTSSIDNPAMAPSAITTPSDSDSVQTIEVPKTATIHDTGHCPAEPITSPEPAARLNPTKGRLSRTWDQLAAKTRSATANGPRYPEGSEPLPPLSVWFDYRAPLHIPADEAELYAKHALLTASGHSLRNSIISNYTAGVLDKEQCLELIYYYQGIEYQKYCLETVIHSPQRQSGSYPNYYPSIY